MTSTSKCLHLLVMILAFISSVTSITIVKIAVILPKDDRYLFSLKKCVPAIENGIQKAYSLGILNRDETKFHIQHVDSGCNGVQAPLAAFDFVTNKTVDIFFGPCCDYSLAPVVRYSKYWNVPVITPGGFARNFAEKTVGEAQYTMLTRVGNNFESLTDGAIKMLQTNSWSNIMMIYDKDGQNSVTLDFCHLAVSALIDGMDKAGINNEFFRIEHDKLNSTDESKFSSSRMLRERVGIDFAGKSCEIDLLGY